jgi:hypothetical protein
MKVKAQQLDHKLSIEKILLRSQRGGDSEIHKPKNLALMIQINGHTTVGLVKTTTPNPKFIARDTVDIASDGIQEIINDDISITIDLDRCVISAICNIRVNINIERKGLNFIIDHT